MRDIISRTCSGFVPIASLDERRQRGREKRRKKEKGRRRKRKGYIKKGMERDKELRK